MTTAADRAAPTWVQLTYTSADAITGVKGGWGVKETTPPHAPSSVISTLRNGVTTRIQEVVETSQFASEAELEARTRRLMFKVADGLPALWHTAAAGLDATGRPGNVYTHAAALVPDDPSMRPIDYWRSADWLVPFGAAEVTAARLGQLRPGTTITRATTVAFLRAQDRVFNLEWVLAAVSHTSAQRKTLVLVADTADEAAQWIGAISYLTSPRLGRRITWVTFERAERLEDPHLAGVGIVAVPRADLDVIAAPPANTLVVDPHWSLDDPGSGPWRTPMGQTFAPDPDWQSGLIDLFALDDDDQILRILAAADDITASLGEGDAAALPLHWALSMAMLADPDVAVIDRAGLTFECLRVAPASIIDVPGIRAMLESVISDLRAEGFLDVVRSDEMGPLLRRAAAGAVMRDYLRGGWRTAEDPDLPASVIPAALDDNQALVAKAITAAQVCLIGSTEQILAGARMLSVLLDHPGPGRGPAETSVLVAAMSSRLAGPDFAAHVDVIAQLNPKLSAGGGTARTPQSQSAFDEAPPRPLQSWDPGAPAPVTTLQPSAPVASEPPPATEHDRDVEAEADLLPSDVNQALAVLLVEATPGSERYFGLADGVRVARGFREVPLWRLPPAGRAAMIETATSQWRAVVGATPLRAVFASWLTVFYALEEARECGMSRAGDTGPISDQLPPALLEEIGDQSDPHLDELVRLLASNPDPRVVAEVAAAAVRKACFPTDRSVLSVRCKDGEVLGWRAVKDVFAAMDRARFAEVMELLEPWIVKVRTSLGSNYDPAYLEELRAFGSSRDTHGDPRVKARRF